ncbi:hypothetical protein LOZ65_000165 [Ophidiomyces ophidiicola]|nr:hypothetical protein LOZ65_000165 [Ophidiomyces ophidiicola]
MTLAANDALPATLKSITDTKLKELSKKQTLFESRKKAIYDEAANQQTLEDKVRILLEGVACVKGFPDDGLDTTDADDAVIRSDGQRVSARHVYYNIRRELVQRKYDSSITDARLRQSEEELRKQLEFISAKHEHALFFNRLVTEWLNNPRNPVPEVPDGKDLGASYKQLERKEVQEQRAQWEKLVFERRQVDGEKIKSYLTNLFHQSSLSEQALKDFRKRIQLSSKQFLTKDDHFTLSSLKWIIGGVISKDILSTDKVAILREFLVNNAVAQEVADVLNVRMAQLDNWSWSSSPIPVEMRRHLNGKYRAYMDEDILDAMFLHYIGVKWSIQFKELFMSLFNSHAWKAQSARIPKQDIERRKYFLYENGREGRDEYNIVGARKSDFLEKYFMCQLPTDTDSMVVYNTDADPEEEKKKTFADLKHSLLHLVMAEIWLNKALHGEITIVQSDFRWFGPSLPHTTLLSILEFFHVPQIWIDFFKRFLEAPLRFVQDGDDGLIRVRQNGVSLSHSISDCLGEVLLFCSKNRTTRSMSGSRSRECLQELWVRAKESDINCTIPNPMEVMPKGKIDFDLETQSRYDIEGLRYSTRRVLQGFQDDGVRYLELRTTPRENQRHEVSKNDYVSAVLDVIDEFENDQMSTYLILSIDRTKSAASALEVVDLAVEYKGRGVVAVELSGDPSRGEVSIFKDAFARAKEHGLYVTLHFAETASSSCPAELETLLSFQPERLGHVINVLNEFKEDIARRKVALELCLSCNVYANKGVFPITISDIGGIKIVQ